MTRVALTVDIECRMCGGSGRLEYVRAITSPPGTDVYFGTKSTYTVCECVKPERKRENEMGMIRIQVGGSFEPNAEGDFSARNFGHAAAVAQAIRWLSDEVLPKAIRLDHVLQSDGDSPSICFGEDSARSASARG